MRRGHRIRERKCGVRGSLKAIFTVENVLCVHVITLVEKLGPQDFGQISSNIIKIAYKKWLRLRELVSFGICASLFHVHNRWK